MTYSNTRWWWVFGLLIALPAACLVALGLWAVRAERIEREQRILNQHIQIAGLVDAAAVNVITALEREASHNQGADSAGIAALRSAAGGKSGGAARMTLEAAGSLVFFDDRVFAGPFGARPAGVPAPPPLPSSVAAHIDEARAAEAQERREDAVSLYRRIGANASTLRPWTDWSIARIGRKAFSIGDEWEATSPGGIPLALLAATDVERPMPERFVRDALAKLRSGAWWLSYDARAFYDEALREMLVDSGAGGPEIGDDPRLELLAAIARSTANMQPLRSDAETYGFASGEAESLFILWSPTGEGKWSGIALRREALRSRLETSLAPLLAHAPFAVGLRNLDGDWIWGKAADGVDEMRVQPLRSVREWEVVFGRMPEARFGSVRVVLYGFVALLALMLAAGLTMTIRTVRREMELGKLQRAFVAAVTHEFKSPITGVRLLLERLSGREHSPERRASYYETISRELDRLEWLINRILTSQQVQSGRAHYKFEMHPIGAIVEETIGLLRPQAEEKDIELISEVQEDVPPLLFDRAALSDALRNMIDNAVKYSPSRTRVRVCATASNGTLNLSVADEGTGIDARDLPRLFDPFYRGSRGDRHDVRGTGLGLALVKATAEAHGGKATVSTSDVGSRFTIEFPLQTTSIQNAESLTG